MLSDAWDAIPPERQRALAEVTQQMRADVARIAEALRPEPVAPAREPDRPPTRAAAQVEDASTRRRQLLESAPVKVLLHGALAGVLQPVPLALAARVVVGAHWVWTIVAGNHSPGAYSDRRSFALVDMLRSCAK